MLVCDHSPPPSSLRSTYDIRLPPNSNTNRKGEGTDIIRPRASPSSTDTMPSILNDDDKATVKRFVPKQSNKIQAVAVARLYVAYPNRSKWTYTGLQGAIVLANDLVGNTYWVKMVDISVGGLSATASSTAELTIAARRPRSHLGSGDLRHMEL